MTALFFPLAAFIVFVLPTFLVWWLGRRAGVPRWMLLVFLLAGWLTLVMGCALSQRAQPRLFPDTSPCYSTGSTPVSQYFPPDSFCLHADGALQTVNGRDAKFVFWTAANTTVAVSLGAAFTRRRRQSA
ncbi:hypothetical protein [Streptomyces sp. NRRL WC-3549]|uniref:hypothetical protein n=1 Tax=Streptomyces sp. NRRL WC-3549 TaxID=1463925 RepID=UPI0004C96982|nr:hypothetical protein [Streptomyces sp. NRRL WC-3549]